MMNTPFKFSDAARLYAQHKAVVDEMYRVFISDIEKFLDALRERVAERVTTGKLDEEGKAGRAWYIWDEEDGDDEVPYIWFRIDDAEIVNPGILNLTVLADGELKPHREKLKTILSILQLGKNARIVQGTGGQTLFTVIISYGADDPIGNAAEPILALLVALFDAGKQVRVAIRNVSPRPTGSKTQS